MAAALLASALAGCGDPAAIKLADAAVGTDTGNNSTAPKASCGHVKSSGVDYKAIAEVLGDNGVITDNSKVKISAGGVAAGVTVDTAFRVLNTASKASALELRLTSVDLAYTAPASATDGATAPFECLVDEGGGKLVPCAGYDFGVIMPEGVECAAAGARGHTQITLLARFHKQADNMPRNAALHIHYLTDELGTKDSVTVFLATDTGAPQISVAPLSVEFGTVKVDMAAAATPAVTNAGNADLVIDQIEVAANDTKAFTAEINGKVYKGGPAQLLDPKLVIKQGESQSISVLFKAVNAAPHVSQLRLYSNDVKSPITTVPLLANTKVPCLTITPSPTVNLGYVVLNSKASKTVTLTSCGNDNVEISALDLKEDADGVYGVDTAKVLSLGGKPVAVANPIHLGKNESATLEVACTPSSENKNADGKAQPFLAKLALSDNTAEPNKVLNLQCQGTTVACPTAIIGLPDGEQVIPQSVVHLKGSASLATQNQTVVKWKWEVLKQPKGAVGYLFFPKDSSPDVVFGTPTVDAMGQTNYQANVAGEYTFKLTVWDGAGNESCNADIKTVVVVPDVGIHVELTWDTPSDQNKTDDEGSDLDLHFANATVAKTAKICKSPAEMCGAKACVCQPDLDADGAPDPWFNSPFDCYWFNAAPKWGNIALNDDDAWLALDDTNGWGPENVNLKSPENSTLYAIGVHYWDGHGSYVDSTATVNVYILGKLEGTFTQPMHECDMWWVKNIDWPSGTLVDFPGANLAMPSAGKITPKYKSNLATQLNGKCK